MKKPLVAGALALALAGSGAGVVVAQSPAPTTTFSMTAKAVTADQSAFKIGFNRLVFKHTGKGSGAFALVRLNAGVTQEQLAAAVGKIKDPAEIAKYGAIVTSTFWAMGPDRYATTIKLEDADYAVLDVAKKPVVRATFHPGPEADAVAAPPASSAHVQLGDYAFKMPSTLKAGKQVVQVTNIGKQMHHALVMPLAKGVNDKKLLAKIDRGQEPRKEIGGPPSALVEMVSPKTGSAQVETNLRKGKYLLVCFLQDTPKDKPHAMKGMRKIVTVK